MFNFKDTAFVSRRFGIGLIVGLILQIGLNLLGQVNMVQAAPDYTNVAPGSIFFSQTGHNLGGAFKNYWDSHGGLAQFGYPLTEQISEISSEDKKPYTVQYFERARFELHPENAGTAYEVLLGLLGSIVAPKVERAPTSATPPDGIYFEGTGHSLGGVFRKYWEAHGGLPIYGYPLTEPYQEKNPDDGKIYFVQYFERNRFELHPENAGTDNEVLLGLLGSQIARQRGLVPPLPEPARPLPNAVTQPTPFSTMGEIKGTALEQIIHSPILTKDESYRIYLPPNYKNSGQRYPVLYMLHGYSGSNTEWIGYKLFDVADQMISSGQIAPLIIVLPTGEQEYWVDHADGGLQWGAYVAKDITGFTDANFRTIPDRLHRAIGGHSMGGHGSLQIALNYSSIFSIVGAHSPTFRTKEQAPDYFGDMAYYQAHDPVSLALNSQTAYSLRIWVDIGEEDTGWLPRATDFHNALESRGISHFWNVFPGNHDAIYWTGHLPDYLKFYSGSFSLPR